MHAVFPVMSGIHSQDSLQLLLLLTTYSGLRSSVTSYVTPSLSTAPTTLSTVDIHGSRRGTRSFSDHSPTPVRTDLLATNTDKFSPHII